jgi:hypothetical protein
MKPLALVPLSVLFLTACNGGVALSPTMEEQLKNPLYAEQYWSHMTDRMVTIIINEEFKDDAGKLAEVDKVRQESLEKAQAMTKRRGEGIYGSFVPVKETTQGIALAVDNMLYLNPDFFVYPGPALHVYLSTVLDPREGTFPDDTAIDLGIIQSPYGAQMYQTPSVKLLGEGAIRTVVLYDKLLGRIYGFAQLAK